MKQEILYIKDTGSFLKKLRATGEIPKGVILVAWRGVAWRGYTLVPLMN